MEIMQYVYTKINNDKYINNDNYKAHTSDKNYDESLKDHLDNVLSTSIDLIDSYDTEEIIDNIILEINPEWEDIIKDLFFSAIYLHDYGKINPIYQRIKMSQSFLDNIIEKLPHDLKRDSNSGHSIISVIFYIDHFFHKYEKLDSEYLDSIIAKFAINILKHHSSHINEFNDVELNKNSFNIYFKLLNEIGFEFKTSDFNSECLFNFLNSMNVCDSKKDEYLYFLLKLNFGLLTKSDYIATSNYMNGYRHKENIIDKKNIQGKFWKSRLFKNGEVNFNSDINLNNLGDKKDERNNKNLNTLRCHMLNEALSKFKKNMRNNNVFFLESPTGGGKTNISFSLVSEAIEKLNIKKVFYIFPFNKLSEQTQSSLVNTFHLDDDDVASISFDSYKEINKSNEESVYKKDVKNIMNNTFLNFPYLLMSHVRFFDILKGNSKKNMYNLHTLSNSLVILDEIQAYNPKTWSKIVYFIKKYSDIFNIKFIIMSATLPKLDKLIGEGDEFIKLIDKRDEYFLNNNFKERVSFSGEYLNMKMDFEKLSELIIEKSEEYFNINETSYTIVEFLYKRKASEFINQYKKKFINKGYEVMLLSSTTLKSRSHRIIKDIKSKIYKKVILICTQTIEAGVDIDMDNGFKDVSVIDSEEQLAGRINRNAKKKGNKLYLVNFENKFIYEQDYRYESIIKYDENYIDILKNKKFDFVYEKVLNKIKENDTLNIENSFGVYFKKLCQLNLKYVNEKFKLIEENENNLTLFIPIDIPLSDVKLVFDIKDELNYFIIDGNIKGEKVWGKYKEIVNAKRFSELKKFQKIFTLFTTNIFLSKDIKENIINYIDYEDDNTVIKKVIDTSIYSYENGFNMDKITNSGESYEFID